jgi:hypothetical protein
MNDKVKREKIKSKIEDYKRNVDFREARGHSP